MGSIDRWAKNQIAKERAHERRLDLRDEATDTWRAAGAATTRQEALQLIEKMRRIMQRHGSLGLSNIGITEESINELLRSKP